MKKHEIYHRYLPGLQALGVLDHSNQSFFFLPFFNLPFFSLSLSLTQSGPGAKSWCAVAQLWLSCGLSMWAAAFWTHPEGLCCLQAASSCQDRSM